MTDNDIREVAKQAAREAVAKQYNDGWAPTILAGHYDDWATVKTAILGALAALDAVAPLIVGRCAEVAAAHAEIEQHSLDYHGGPDWHRSIWRAKREAAEMISKDILALAPKEGETT